MLHKTFPPIRYAKQPLLPGTRVVVESDKHTTFDGERGALVTVLGFGEMLANPNNRITLSNQKDEYGVYKINIDAHLEKTMNAS